MEVRRERITKEILHTENTYLHHLEVTISCFLLPLHGLSLIPEHVIVTVFSNIEQINCVNKELLQHLQTLGVGNAFLKLAPFLKLYSTYANNHERALATLLEWEQKNASFGTWRRQQEDLPELKGLKLNALLITPVQRIPRYKLLLEDLLQCTEPSRDDYNAIQESVRCVSEVAMHINDHIKQQDNFNKMVAIQRSLSGGSTAPKIIVPGRVFIKEGVLSKLSKNGKGRCQDRKFFLFSDILMYAKHKLLENSASGSYSCSCILPLQHCQVNRVLGHSSQGDGALFTIACKQESLLLFADHKIVDSWIETLQSSILSLQACRQTLRKPSSAKQPLRRPGLIHLRRLQKVTDPLASVSKNKTPERLKDRLSYSPRKFKRALQDTDMNCLSPRKHSRSTELMISPPYDAKRLATSNMADTAKIVSEGLKQNKVTKMATLDEHSDENIYEEIDNCDLEDSSHYCSPKTSTMGHQKSPLRPAKASRSILESVKNKLAGKKPSKDQSTELVSSPIYSPISPDNSVFYCSSDDDVDCTMPYRKRTSISPNSILSAAAHSPTYRHSSYRTRHGSSSTSSSNHSGSSSTSYPTFRRHQSVLDDSLTSTTSEWPESAEWYMKTYSATDIQQYLDRTAHLSDVNESP